MRSKQKMQQEAEEALNTSTSLGSPQNSIREDSSGEDSSSSSSKVKGYGQEESVEEGSSV